MTSTVPEMATHLYITGCREKIYSESVLVAKQCRLINATYFVPQLVI